MGRYYQRILQLLAFCLLAFALYLNFFQNDEDKQAGNENVVKKSNTVQDIDNH